VIDRCPERASLHKMWCFAFYLRKFCAERVPKIDDMRLCGLEVRLKVTFTSKGSLAAPPEREEPVSTGAVPFLDRWTISSRNTDEMARRR